MIALAALASAAVLQFTPGHAGHPTSISTLAGKEYNGVEILKVDPDGLTFRHDRGMAKVAFRDMPFDLRDRYSYDPQVANEFVRDHTVRNRQATSRRYITQKRNTRVQRVNRVPYGIVRDPVTGLIGAATNPATPFYQSPYSNLSIADQLRVNHFSKHTQRVYGGATVKSNNFGPRYLPYVRNPYPRQIGTFGVGPSGGSIIPPARSGFSTAGAIAPSLAP
ncbi:MAG: hypothetical protein AAGJ79_15270, partial [Verrucomicrobiota bacterium]